MSRSNPFLSRHLLHERLIDETVAGRSVVDVGANKGDYTARYLAAGARRIVAVEPGPNLATYLRVRFADDDACVVVRQEGLSSSAGKLEGVRHHHCWCLARPGEFPDKTNRLSEISPGAEAVEGVGPFDVRLTTLDEVVAEHSLSDLAIVKVDVDGYEDRVLRGAEMTLRDLRPSLFLELSYLVQDYGDDVGLFLDRIYDSGYVIATIYGEVATRRQVWEHYPWHTSYNVLMLPTERATELELPALVT